MSLSPNRAWVLLPVLLFLVYVASFSPYRIIAEKVSVVGEADAASYGILYREFELATPIGNPRNLDNRSLRDVAQKHKLHHILSASFGHAVYVVAAPVYRLLGLRPEAAVFLPGALLGALNVVLLALLLHRANPNGNPILPFLLLYGISLSPWIYAAVPDSWPLTTGLFLTFLLLVRAARWPTLWLGALLGLFMLNNMALAALVGLLWLRDWRAVPLGTRLLGRAVLTLLLMLGVWFVGLSLLSLFDPGFRPDRYWAFSRWFRDHVGANLPLTSLYVWKSALSNLFVNAVTTNQSDPNIPQEAMLLTLRSSPLGVAAILALLGLLTAAVVRLARHSATLWRTGGGPRAALTDPDVFPALWCGVMVGVTLAIFYAGGFTYAALTVPALALLLCRYLNLRNPLERTLVWAAVLLILLNNVVQVLRFRTVLAAMA